MSNTAFIIQLPCSEKTYRLNELIQLRYITAKRISEIREKLKSLKFDNFNKDFEALRAHQENLIRIKEAIAAANQPINKDIYVLSDITEDYKILNAIVLKRGDVEIREKMKSLSHVIPEKKKYLDNYNSKIEISIKLYNL